MSSAGEPAIVTTDHRPREDQRFDPTRARRDFPILQPDAGGKRLVFLDSAASAQKPQCVIDAISDCYSHAYANIHRGVYRLSANATAMFEGVRENVQQFIGAAEPREIIFVRNTTEAINLVAATYGRENLDRGDEVLITTMEHHSNIVPWQMLCEQTGAVLRVAPVDDRGALRLDEFEKLLSPRTKIVAVAHISNALGSVNPVAEISRMAHGCGAAVLVDGAQAPPHQRVDVGELDCDFYAFSGHKIFGPSGVGVLYGKARLLEAMPPYQGGGSMIRTVSFEKTSYETIPHRFEAGTPDIAGVCGLGAAVDYLRSFDLEAIAAHENELLSYTTDAMTEIPGLRIIGTAPQKVSVVSFVIEGVHAHDVGTVLDDQGIAVRAGHHCAQPLMERFGVAATVRASFALYNTREDVDSLIRGLHTVRELFG
jgi:cysteine desulfurase/selenocysteine lyase